MVKNHHFLVVISGVKKQTRERRLQIIGTQYMCVCAALEVAMEMQCVSMSGHGAVCMHGRPDEIDEITMDRRGDR